MLRERPEFSEIVYFQTVEELWDAVHSGAVDAACPPDQGSNAGFLPNQQTAVGVPGSRLYVIAETTHAYHCSLLGKPGTSVTDVRHVIGHTGSISQSRGWIRANLPNATIEIIHTNSRVAARTVLEGDGSVASVGTPEMGRDFGLTEFAKDIDGGSIGNYWAVSRDRIFDDAPTRLVVAGRFGDDGKLTALIGALAGAGYTLATVFPMATGKALFEYDYVLRFRGAGTLKAVNAAIDPFPSARLVGAFVVR
jgi:prephenate dehydratase